MLSQFACASSIFKPLKLFLFKSVGTPNSRTGLADPSVRMLMPIRPRLQHVASALRRASTAQRPHVPRPTGYISPRPSEHTAHTNSKRTVKDEVSQVGLGRQLGKSYPTFTKSRALPWTLLCLTGGYLGFYLSQLALDIYRPCTNPEIRDLANQKDVSDRYNTTASSFDSEVNLSEMLSGVLGMRKKLAKKCSGHVLEVSCGTGRNLGYYDIGRESAVRSLTFVDLSPQMVEECKKKWSVLLGDRADEHPTQRDLKGGLTVRFLTGSALSAMPPAPTKRKYDTVIQTMGLCSTPAPKELLLNMVAHLDTSNPDSRILLLEHGRSHRSWMNSVLDKSAEKHAEKYGCWYNRDIGAVVEEAAAATGMEVVEERRRHFGTTWMFELRPSAGLVEKSLRGEGLVTKAEGERPLVEEPSWWQWLRLS